MITQGLIQVSQAINHKQVIIIASISVLKIIYEMSVWIHGGYLATN